MNTTTKIVITVCGLVLGFSLGHAVSKPQDDVMNIQKTVYTTATTTVSISQEELDCKKQGGEFQIFPKSVATMGIDSYGISCILPSKVLSSKTISVGN